MNIRNPVETADKEFEASVYITENLTTIIINQETDFSNYDEEDAMKRIKDAKAKKEQ